MLDKKISRLAVVLLLPSKRKQTLQRQISK